MGLAPLERNAMMRSTVMLIAVALYGSHALTAVAPLSAEEPTVVEMPGTVASNADQPKVIVVVGAPGGLEYAQQFRQWAERWSQAAKQGSADCQTIGLELPAAEQTEQAERKTDREVLQAAIEVHAGQPAKPLWLVLIGHGTFDGKTARFNLHGPDISSKELSQWLSKVTSPLAVINCTASSGPFLAELSGPHRVVITATRSGNEFNFAHFGEFLSAAIADRTADLDKDDQTSLFEAYLKASAMLREFYADNSRLATEHALLDDNGDRLGTPAEWFQGLRPIKSAKLGAAIDGTAARQFILIRSTHEQQLSMADRDERDELERQIADLRLRKSQMNETEYLVLLEPLAIELAKLAQRAETNP
jgi:hypothetical protein